MKKVLLLLVLITFATFSFAVEFSSSPKNENTNIYAGDIMIPIGKTGTTISLLDLSTIKIKDYETVSGKKLKFFEKVKFKLLQKQLKNSLKEDGSLTIKISEKNKLTSKKADEKTRKYLRLWLILLGASLVLYLLGILLTPLFYVAYLASLGALIFFILWIISMSGGI